MGSSSKTTTIGYKYYVGMHMILCQGPVDSLFQIKVADKVAWLGLQTNGTFYLDNPELFGGETREGGVQGYVDFEPGGPSQGQNSYLASLLGSLVPNFRGMVGIVLRTMYVGLNPYLKTWNFKVSRIHTRQNGIAQWYDAKAAIPCIPGISQDASVKLLTRFDNANSDDISSYHIGPGTYSRSDGISLADRSVTFGLETGISSSPLAGILWSDNHLRVNQYANKEMTWEVIVNFINVDNNYRSHCVFMIIDSGEFAADAGAQVRFGIDGGVPGDSTCGKLAYYPDAQYTVTYTSPTSYLDTSVHIAFQRRTNGDARLYLNGIMVADYGDITGFGDGSYTGKPGEILICNYGYNEHIQFKFEAVRVSQKLVYTTSTFVPPTASELVADLGIFVPAMDNMNPAHIIRECLTDPYWGMGYQDADIDDPSFIAAADTLYNEGMGMSILWESQSSIEEFIKLITKHIDATVYVDISTGKFVLKLIRDDYSINSLITLNESNIDKITDFSRPQFGELTNSVTVTYWDMVTEKDATITISDTALVQMQNCTINASIQYPGFTNVATASKAAQRDLRTLSTPIITCTIYTNKDAASLNIGETFKLTWPDYDLTDVVMRVTGIGFGDGKSNRIRLQCVQDVFSTPSTAFIPYTPPAWTNPVQPPVASPYSNVFETPYFELVQLLGQTDIDSKITTEPNIGYIGVSAVRPGNSINARMYTNNGAGYVERVSLDYSPAARLNGAIAEMDTTFPIDGGVDLNLVTVGTWAEIDNEIVAVVALTTTSITVKRGCLDTLPVVHADDAWILFWDEYADGDQIEYVTSDSIDVKLCTITGEGKLDINDAPSDNVVMGARAVRPYPPANIKISGSYYPTTVTDVAISLTWAHRDRKQQTAGLIGFTEASIGPEAGVTYSIRLYDHITSALLHSVDNLTGTSYSSFPSFTVDYTLRLEMWSIRSTYQCFQKYVHTFSYLNTTYLLTESSDNYITESGDFITME